MGSCRRRPRQLAPGRTPAAVVATVLIFGLGCSAGSLPAMAQQDLAPAAALERLFAADSLSADWFAPNFLTQVPLAQVELIVTQLRAALGELQAVEGAGTDYRLTFARGAVPAQIVLDDRGRITGLFFGPPEARATGLDEALASFAELPGQVSVLVLRDGVELAALNADAPLAVGSAFKLAVLAALRQEIEAGQRAWTDVVRLEAAWRSLPTGILQAWPVGSPLSLHTLAALMISLSDNTATDALIHILGREAVEAFSLRNRPLLTTREYFTLKNPANGDLLERYRAADEAGRRAVLADVPRRPLPDPGLLAVTRALDLSWFFSTRELCALMGLVQDLPLMAVNPGVADPGDWLRVAYKGGSEPGVLNLTTALAAGAGHGYCVSATWNHSEALEDLRFYGLYSGLLQALRQLSNAP